MPTVTAATVEAFAFCPDARCIGYRQEPVQGIQTHTDIMYTEYDPNGSPGVERSFNDLAFADVDDIPCTHCEKPRMISTQVRPEYPNVSGHDPMGLFEFKGKTEHEIRELKHAKEIDDLERKAELLELRQALAAQSAQIAQLLAAQEKPKPARGKPTED